MSKEIEQRLDTLKERIRKLKEADDNFTALQKSTGQAILHDGFAEVFKKYPEMTSFSWTQYTPFWCDGGACDFSVGEVSKVNGVHKRKFQLHDWYPLAAGELYDLLYQVGDEIMQRIYGDHAEITVRKKLTGYETTVEEYDHDYQKGNQVLEQTKAKLESFKVKRDELLKQQQIEGQIILQESFAAMFAQFPELESIHWRQYTPYFNDGDECVFRVWDDYDINGICDYRDQSAWSKECRQAVRELTKSVGEELMQVIYGDHVTITIARTGDGFSSTIEHYEHD